MTTAGFRGQTGALVGMLAAVALCAACGATTLHAAANVRVSARSAPTARTATASPSPSARPTGRASARRNHAATVAEVRRLLTLLTLPAHARHAAPLPALSQPALGTPAAGSLVQRTRYWWVPESMPAVLRYYRTHAPAGLSSAGAVTAGTTTSGTPTTEGLGWSEPNRSYARSLQLGVNLAPRHGGTEVRVDAMGVWLDPRPARDTTPGQRRRVTFATGCPVTQRGVTDVRNPNKLRRELRVRLLPQAMPVRVLVCTYGDVNSTRPDRLASHRVLRGVAAAALASNVNSIDLAHPAGAGGFSCPSETLANTLLVFGYHGAPDVDLWDHRSGCEFVSNGVIRVDRRDISTRAIRAAGAGSAVSKPGAPVENQPAGRQPAANK